MDKVDEYFSEYVRLRSVYRSEQKRLDDFLDRYSKGVERVSIFAVREKMERTYEALDILKLKYEEALRNFINEVMIRDNQDDLKKIDDIEFLERELPIKKKGK